MQRFSRIAQLCAAMRRPLGIGLFFGIIGSVPLYAQQATVKPTIALMNFTNAALANRADYDPLEWSVPELISGRLARNSQIQVVDRRRLQALLDEQNLGASGRVDDATAAHIGKLLGARYMVFGTVLIDRRNRLRIDARVLEVETSKLIQSETFRDVDWNEDVSFAIDSLAERLNRNLRLPGRIAPARPGQDTASQQSAATARPADAPAVAAATPRPRSGSAGLITMGESLRRLAKSRENSASAIAMLRTAAVETPSLARDVEDIVRRLNSGAP